MKIRDTARRAVRSLRQAKVRTLLTSLAISVGAFTVTLALAAGAGGQAYTNSLIENNGDMRNLRVMPVVTDEEDGTPKEYGAATAAKQGMLGDDDIAKIKQIPGVADITPVYNINAAYMTRGGDAKKYETVLAIKADRTAIPLQAGSLPNNQVPVGGVAISENYLGVLGFANAKDAIGKTVTVHIEKEALGLAPAESMDKTFKIVAVDKRSSTVLHYSSALNLSTEDGKAIYDFQADSQQSNHYFSVNARVADDADVEAVQKDIEAAGYMVFSMQELQEALFQFINVVQWGAAGFGFLAILASVFGIINTQYISVLERTQQIGLMKALGARSKDIGRLFRFEAAWVGFFGALIGTILALLLGLLNPIIADTLGLEKGTELLIFHPLTSLVLIGSLIVVAVLAGYFPSRKAAKLDPIEALRTE